MQKIILIFILIIGILVAANMAHADSKKIVKWVDNHGVTHYGDRPPSFEESKSNSEMNAQGIVVKKNTPASPKNDAQDLQKEAQDRKDKILQASYTNANEIDLARDRSLEMDKAAMTSLSTQKENINARIARNKQIEDGFKSRKKALPTNLDAEFKATLAQSAKIDQQVTERKLEMEQTRKRFGEDKLRFILLQQPTGTTENAAGALPASTTEAKVLPKK